MVVEDAQHRGDSEEAGDGVEATLPVLVLNADSWIGRAVVRALQGAARPCVAVTEEPGVSLPGPSVQTCSSEDPWPPVHVVVLVPPEEVAGEDPETTWPAWARARLARAEAAGARRLVLVTGLAATGPRDAVADRFESEAPRPADAVGRALAAIEDEGRAFHGRTEGEIVILRPGQLHGDGRMGALADLATAMSEDGGQSVWGDVRHQPVHLLDLAAAVVLTVDRGVSIYHVTRERSATCGEQMQELARAARRKGLPLRATKPKVSSPPSSECVHWPWPSHRLTNELGWRPRWTLEGAFADLVDAERLQGMADRLGLQVSADLTLGAEAASGELEQREGHFWDEIEAADPLLYEQPHDWAFDPQLGNVIQAPAYRFLEAVFGKQRPRRILDLGCGSGVYSRWMANAGIRSVGIDLSPGKIAKAQKLAAAEGVEALCDYRVANAMEFTSDEPFDAVCAFGVLHHFPDLEHHLPEILERNLAPGGLLVALEPHCEEGYHPRLQRLMHFFGRTWLRRFFDIERHQRIAEEARLGLSLRGESPAGLEVHDHEHVEIDDLLKRDFEPVRIRYTHLLSPFVANAFVIYQRSRLVRGLTRLTMPLTVRLDGFLCRFRRFQRWAALGLYAVRRRA